MTDARTRRALRPLARNSERIAATEQRANALFLVGEVVSIAEDGSLTCEVRSPVGGSPGYVRNVVPESGRYTSRAIVRNAHTARTYVSRYKDNADSPTDEELELFDQGARFGYYIQTVDPDYPQSADDTRYRWAYDTWAKVPVGSTYYIVETNGDISQIVQPQGSGGVRYFSGDVPYDPDTSSRIDSTLRSLIETLASVSDIERAHLQFGISGDDNEEAVALGVLSDVFASTFSISSIVITKDKVDIVCSTAAGDETRITMTPQIITMRAADDDESSSLRIDKGRVRIDTDEATPNGTSWTENLLYNGAAFRVRKR